MAGILPRPVSYHRKSFPFQRCYLYGLYLGDERSYHHIKRAAYLTGNGGTLIRAIKLMVFSLGIVYIYIYNDYGRAGG